MKCDLCEQEFTQGDLEYFKLFWKTDSGWESTERLGSIEELNKLMPNWKQIDPHILKKFTVINIE